MGTIRAWLCDLDGTLYRAGRLKWGMAGELLLLGPHRVPLLRSFRRAHEALREELREAPELAFLPSPFEEQLRRVLGPHASVDDPRRAAVWDWMVHRPGKWLRRSLRTSFIEEIRAFREGGGQTAVVSDYPAASKLAAMGIAELFDAVVANGEHPELTRLKPAPDGYLLAATALGVEPAACLVIGDRDDADGEAARRAGMHFRLII